MLIYIMNFQFKMNIKPVNTSVNTPVKTDKQIPTPTIRRWSMIDRVHKAKAGCGSCGR
jgi:hypothetical protein